MIQGFQVLHCPKCDGSRVFQTGELVWQEGKGQSLRPLGYTCFTCMVSFDTEGAIKTLKQKELAAKIKELENGSR